MASILLNIQTEFAKNCEHEVVSVVLQIIDELITGKEEVAKHEYICLLEEQIVKLVQDLLRRQIDLLPLLQESVSLWWVVLFL